MIDCIYLIFRRSGWLFGHFLTLDKFWNYVLIAFAYLARRERTHAWPAVLKIDISPMCNLRCPVCVHADSQQFPILKSQAFKNKYMSLGYFRQLVDQVSGKVSAFSLYYLGDPYMHPNIDSFCRTAHDAGINVHLSTNFSFKFSNERIANIARSGVTHLTVCVDGISQETYGRTRVGGKLALVLSNLERLCRYRTIERLKHPKIEVQFIKFSYNVHEFPAARSYFNRLGVDHVESFWGAVSNFSEFDAIPHTKAIAVGPLPRCFWPFATMTIKYNGDVIPCCHFRYTAQYANGGNSKALGNIFREGVLGMWNSEAYRNSRRLSSNPSAAHTDSSLKNHFCYGCPLLYQGGSTNGITVSGAAKSFNVSSSGRSVIRRRAQS